MEAATSARVPSVASKLMMSCASFTAQSSNLYRVHEAIDREREREQV